MVRLAAALFALLVLAVGQARAGCKDVYPDDQVSAFLAKEAYGSCDINTMTADFAALLTEEVRLLALLEQAYARYLLSQGFDDDQRQTRLAEFAADLTALAENAAAFASGSLTDDDATVDPPPRAQWLRASKTTSRRLASHIALIEPGLDNSELVVFCKLDFYFRVRDGLHALYRDCLR
jgi:hypothetical protein